MNQPITRKEFLTLSALGGLGLLAGGVTAAEPDSPPSRKLRHACIGVGGMGGVDMDVFMQHPQLEVVAICDVDKNHLEAASHKAPGARKYSDWRELLAKEGDQIDSCNVSVPDHMHAAIALAAMRSGKHVYCQKPLAHDVAECRALTIAARKAGVVTQLGTQFASGRGDLMAVQLLRQGVIGKIRNVYTCSNRPGVADYRIAGPRPDDSMPPPDSLDWDLWLGTAPERPFAPNIYHPGKWRSWQDFGTGWSGDIGCHILDAVWKGLELTAPVSVIAQVQESWRESKARRADTWPQTNHITWKFPASQKTDGELTIEWFDGEKYPPAEIQAIALADKRVQEYPAEAAMLIGTEGAMLIEHQRNPLLFPAEKFASIVRPEIRGPNHYHRFVNACLGGEKTQSHFEQSGPMSEAIILGTVAIRVPDTVLKWDAKNLRITNSPEAQKLLRRTYRKGWETDLNV